MSKRALFGFEVFSREFVRKYWETVKNDEFSMPPDEPVTETVEELLSQVSYETGIEPSSGRTQALRKLRMTDACGDWWLFTFQESGDKWALIRCSAGSDDDENPHDLLDPVYSRHFAPFLRYVTEAANNASI